MGQKDTPEGRRAVFAERLRKLGVRFAVVSNPKHIFYLTGVSSNLNPYYVLGKGQRSISFLAVGNDDQSSLLLGSSEVKSPFVREDTAVQSVNLPIDHGLSLYADYDLDVTMVPYASDISPEVKKWLRKVTGELGWRAVRKVGVEDWHLPVIYQDVVSKLFPDGKTVGVSETIMDMRKTKGKDELENLRRATKALDYAYAFGKTAVKPGNSELDMFRAMSYAAFEKYGVFGIIGGDVVSGERTLGVGGMASSRKFRRGETVVIDMQIAYNNYWSDTARTFAVGRPSPEQEKALETIIEAKDIAARMLKPGTSTAAIADAVNGFLTHKGYREMPHHVGHTIGLDDQERPWLIRGSKDVVRENQAYVIEPGIYDKSIGGLRVEDCYIVTRGGREKVSSFPLRF